MINFAKNRRLYFIFSAILITAGLIAMFISTRTYENRSIVRLSIDFVGGSLFEVRISPAEGQSLADISGQEVEEAFTRAGLTDVTAQRLIEVGRAEDANTLRWQVRSSFVGGENVREDTLNRIAGELNTLAASRNGTFNAQFFRDNLASVSPAIGNEVTNAAVVATLFASLLVLAWIAFAFRTVKHSFRYGICALLAMLHDVLVMVGAMSILGLLAGWEADALFLTGLLTVVGYSVQDTIVVFDRIRENEARHRGEPFEMIVNRSLMETVQRSLMTQIAVAFVLVSLFLVGGGPIHQFVGVLLVGLLSGTYSSIFVAVPLLVAWERGELPFVNRGARPATA